MEQQMWSMTFQEDNKQVFERMILGNIRLCLVTVFVFYFQKLVFGSIKKILVFLKSKTC